MSGLPEEARFRMRVGARAERLRLREMLQVARSASRSAESSACRTSRAERRSTSDGSSTDRAMLVRRAEDSAERATLT